MRYNRNHTYGISAWFKFAAAWLTALVPSFLGAGCDAVRRLTGRGDSGEFGSYVMRMEPNQLTDWTLGNLDDDTINDGIAGLRNYTYMSDCERRAAFAGIRKIYTKLQSDWPGYTGVSRVRGETGPLPDDVRHENLEFTIKNLYRCLLESKSPEGVRLFREFQPDPGQYPKRYANWWNLGQTYNVSGLEAVPKPQTRQ